MRNYNSIEAHPTADEDVALLPSIVERRRATRPFQTIPLLLVVPPLLLLFLVGIIMILLPSSITKWESKHHQYPQRLEAGQNLARQQESSIHNEDSRALSFYQIIPSQQSHVQLEQRLVKWEEWKTKIGIWNHDDDGNSSQTTTPTRNPKTRQNKNESSFFLGTWWNGTQKELNRDINVTGNALQRGWNATGNAVHHGWSKVWNWTEPGFEKAWNKTANGVQHGWNATEEEAIDLWNATEEKLEEAWNVTAHKVEEAWDLTKEELAEGWNKTETWFQTDVVDRVKHWWNSTTYSAKQWIKHEEEQTMQWLNDTEHEAAQWLNDTEHETVQWVQDEGHEVVRWAYNITHNPHRKSALVMLKPMYMNTTLAYHFLMTGKGLFLDFSKDYFLIQQGHDAQINQAYCAVATSAAILNSFRGLIGYELPIDPLYDPHAYATQHSILENDCVHANVVYRNETFDGVLSPPGGLSMPQTKALLECHFPKSKWKVRAVPVNPNNISREQMRQDMMMALHDPLSRVIINYDRKTAGQIGGGHWSPLGSYSVELDAFLIMDMAKYKYPAAWVSADTIYRSLQTRDNCGDWAFPQAQDKLPGVLSTFPPTTEDDFRRAFPVLGCKTTHRGYVIVTRLPDENQQDKNAPSLYY